MADVALSGCCREVSGAVPTGFLPGAPARVKHRWQQEKESHGHIPEELGWEVGQEKGKTGTGQFQFQFSSSHQALGCPRCIPSSCSAERSGSSFGATGACKALILFS